MKFIKILMVLCALLIFSKAAVMAQNPPIIKIKARVTGSDKQPVIGAVVSSSDETGKTAATDASGNFSIEIPEKQMISVVAKGFKTKHITADPKITEIVIFPEEHREPVHLAFRNADKEDLPVGVASVNVKELLNKNYFTYILEGMESFVPGFNGNSNWGMGSYLFMIDGVPRETGNVMPTEIEQIVFLKGANAVALYGSRAAKGVVNVITKRGVAGQSRFDLRVNSGVNVPKALPRYLGSAEYMTLYNEARRNDGLTNLYSETDIYNYASGINKYRYPNIDFYSSEYLKSSYGSYDLTAEISGGNERVKYYTNLGFATSGSLLNFGEAKTNNNSDRLNFRGNIDVNLNDYISLNADATAIFIQVVV
ncbi:hypothetical protein ACFFJX_10540 [Pseudarcicella hirudinis]|uniref:hypothetical protein n=1 Tax=Pseudarcicella hirudinis TaxID=1079859 RepID=UPI0035E706B6